VKSEEKTTTPEQIIRKLREAERMLGEGKQVPEVAKELEVSEQTFHRWRNQYEYGGMKAEDVMRLKELERENRERHEPKRASDDAALRKRLCADLQRQEALGLPPRPRPPDRRGLGKSTRKRVQRLWREEGLRVPRRKRKRARLGGNADGKELRAERPDHVWALNFQCDETADGRQLRVLNVIPEFHP